MAELLKKYRLMHGKHRAVNPEYNPEKDGPEKSHYLATEGALLDLTDVQYEAFKDKFEPAESVASDVKSADQAKMAAAKIQAAKTGQPVNPNV